MIPPSHFTPLPIPTPAHRSGRKGTVQPEIPLPRLLPLFPPPPLRSPHAPSIKLKLASKPWLATDVASWSFVTNAPDVSRLCYKCLCTIELHHHDCLCPQSAVQSSLVESKLFGLFPQSFH